MSIYFDAFEKLSYTHDCEGCSRYPLDDKDEPCLLCGYSQNDVGAIIEKLEKMNKCYEKYGNEFKGADIQTRHAYLHVTHVSLGGGDFDTITLSDIDMSDDIRELADLTDFMVEVAITPTNIVIKEPHDKDEFEEWEEEYDE